MNRLLKITSLLTLSSLMIVGCGETPVTNPEDPILISISLDVSKAKTTFELNEAFSYEGLVVYAHYDEFLEVVNPTSVSTPDMSTSGVKDVTVTYLTKDAHYSITVNEEGQPEITLSSISLSGSYNTSFTVGDEFSYAGLVVTAHYSNGDTSVVTPTSVSTPDMTSAGTKTVTVTYLTETKTYQIAVNEKEDEPEEEETYKGHMYFASNTYSLNILMSDKSKHYLNPGIKDKDNKDVDVSDFPFTFEFDESLIDVTKYGGISSKNVKTGSCVVTCIYTEDTSIKASCTVNVVSSLSTKEKAWVRVDDYDSLHSNDILVIASPEHGAVASLNTLHSKLNPVNATFSSNYKTITSMDDDVAEFVLGIEEKGMTLEAQTGEYLICTHQGKVKLDKSSNTNKYWDIHSNVDIEEGTGSIDDGVVIENEVESLGYMMFNVSQDYFSTYVDNSISQYMKLPFIYRLEEVK